MRKISKALVTGGAGFIGSHIVDELVSKGVETYVIDNLSTGSMDNLAQHQDNRLVHVLVGDARDVRSLMHDVKDIDVVLHEAAIASVPKSVSHPMLVHDTNVNMTLHLMNYCVESGVRRFVFASSAAVYGIIEEQASEGMVCKPNSPYGASKLAIEDYLHAYRHTYGLETVMLRYFNVFGSRQKFSDYSGVITVFINKLLAGEVPTIHGDGLQSRDFVHVKDIAHANMLAMESASAVGEVFNVASGKETSILELFRTLQSIAHSESIEPRFGPPRAGDMKFGAATIDKISSALLYRPRVSMAAGLAELTESTRKKIPLSAAAVVATAKSPPPASTMARGLPTPYQWKKQEAAS